MNIWDNPQNYKPCKKKQYEIWVCKPPQGTVIINKLEQADSVIAAGGRTYFTAREISTNPKIAAGVQQLLQAGKAYLVKDDQTFVLCGTESEMWCISGAKLAKKYVWASDGSPINDKTLKERAYIRSNPIKGTTTLLDWTKVRTVPDNSTAFACFVPFEMKGQIQTSWAILNINGAHAFHGKGDFVIAANVNGQPDLSSRYVVNGNVFRDTYDNRGWRDCLDITPMHEIHIWLEDISGKESEEHASKPDENLMGNTLKEHAKTNINFDRQKIYATYKKAAKRLDKNGYLAKEVRTVAVGSDPLEKELAARLNSEDFACMRVVGTPEICVLFPDMTVYYVDDRNMAAPFGAVTGKGVLQSKSDVRVLFGKTRILEMMRLHKAAATGRL